MLNARISLAGAVVNAAIALIPFALRTAADGGGVFYQMALVASMILGLAGLVYAGIICPKLLKSPPSHSLVSVISACNGVFGSLLLCWVANWCFERCWSRGQFALASSSSGERRVYLLVVSAMAILNFAVLLLSSAALLLAPLHSIAYSRVG